MTATGTLETLILLAIVGMLVILRFDARRFGAAEYDDKEAPGGWRTWLRRLSWYVLSFALIIVVYFVHPLPLSTLHLQIGSDRLIALISGLALGGLGISYALAYAWWRYRELRLPPLHRYPAGVLNAIATAFIDEAAFRGILLGLLVASNWPVQYAIAFQAVLYAMSTRLAGKGKPMGMLVLSLGLGLIAGWLTLQTGGIGAAFLGHVLTRFAVFIATGHAGQLRPTTTEEEIEERAESSQLTPVGWEVVGDTDSSGPRDYRW